jgi:translation initiation factor 1A
MPKNTVGGKKYKQQKHKTDENLNKPLLLKEKDQEYASVTKLLGHSRVSATFYDNNLKREREINCVLRPGLKKKRQWAKMGSIILISLRDFEKDRADVIHVYNDDEARKLRNKNIINSNLFNKDDDKDDEFDFNGEDDEEEIKPAKEKKIQIKPKNNLSVQDFGLPPSSFSSDESDVDIENI